MGFFGNLIGQGLGALGSKFIPIEGVDGQKLGGTIGNLFPFKHGGRVGKYKGAIDASIPGKKVKAKKGKKSKK